MKCVRENCAETRNDYDTLCNACGAVPANTPTEIAVEAMRGTWRIGRDLGAVPLRVVRRVLPGSSIAPEYVMVRLLNGDFSYAHDRWLVEDTDVVSAEVLRQHYASDSRGIA